MTLDEVRSAFGFRPEITDQAMIQFLEGIECGWVLQKNVPVHDVIFERLDRQRDEFLPPPDEDEIAALLAAIQQAADKSPETLPSEEGPPADCESDKEVALPGVDETVVADSAPPALASLLDPLGLPTFTSVSSSPMSLSVERSSISSKMLGFALIAIVVVVVVAFLYSHYNSVPTVKESPAMVQSTIQKKQPQESSQVEPVAAPPMPKQFSWERSRERMLRRIGDRRGE